MLAAGDTLDQPPTQRATRGVSLVELLMAAAILAALAQTVAPTALDFLHRSRLTSSVSTLVADLNYARGEALARNAPVIVCAKAAASADCAAAPNWQAGWVVCVDANADNICDTTAAGGANPIRVRHAVSSATVITAGAAVLRFTPAGGASGDSAFTIAGGRTAAPARSVRVAANGSVQAF